MNPYNVRHFLSVVVILLTGIAPLFAQREMDHWLFGTRVHLDFSSGNPVQLASGTTLNTTEGTAVISDATGNLLFYTDGRNVWTASHTLMPNGTGLLGHASSTQSALIIPIPGSATLYYVFTSTHEANPTDGIRYSIVDISLNGGAGDVTATKNVVLLPGPTTEKLTAVKHCNGTDFWVLTRGYGNTQLIAFLVTAAGVNTTPVITNSPLSTAGLQFNNSGHIKASPNGNRVAFFNAWNNTVELTEFNPWTGAFSNIQLLEALPAAHMAIPSAHVCSFSGEFSPDGHYLYTIPNYYIPAMGARSRTLVVQYDISSMNAAAIHASRYVLDSFQGLSSNFREAGGSMQIANNGKIYIGAIWDNALSVIHNPNNAGAACNYQARTIPLTSGTNFNACFPNFFPYFAAQYLPSDFTFTGNCEGPDVSFRFNNPSLADSLIWDFGDPASGAANASRLDSPTHLFTSHGLYTVRLVVYKTAATICDDPVDTVIRLVYIPHLDIGNDTTLCSDSLRLPLHPITYPGGTYLWSTGDTTPAITAKSSGIYWLEQIQHGCTTRDSIEVNLDGNPELNLGNDTTICDSDLPFTLEAQHYPGARYTWSTGLTGTQISVTKSGMYWVEAEMEKCRASDTIYIEVVPVPEVSAGRDTVICADRPIRIGTVVADAAYLWNTGETTPYIEVSETGTYVLSVDLKGCIVYDTVHITAMPVPDIDLGGDRDICAEQTIILDASYGNNTRYVWSTGETTSSVAVTEAGIYSVTVITEYTCVGGDTVAFTYYPDPVVALGHDTSVCEETPLLLSAFHTNADSLVWSDGRIGNSILIQHGGIYTVTGINKCGTDTDTIEVKQIFCDIWLPNAFTPNGDGKNDVFRILGNIGRLEGVTFSVFNRWGERVFITNDKLEGWDGYHRGIAAQLGTYVYLLQYSLDGHPYTQKGSFHLLR